MNDSVIYFVQAGGFIKIGTTTNLRARLAALQNASPHPLALLRAFPSDTLRERAIHRRFDDFHIRGEWYEDVPAIRQFLQSAGDEELPLPTSAPRRMKAAPKVSPTVILRDLDLEPRDGVVNVSRPVPSHFQGEDVIACLKFMTYLIIDKLMETSVGFDTLHLSFTHPLQETGDDMEIARIVFARQDCLHILTPQVHFFGALEFAESVSIHPAFARWINFPKIGTGVDGRPIVLRDDNGQLPNEADTAV